MHISDPDFQPGTQLTLPADEVHLWRVDLEAVASSEARWRKVLSPDELARAARFHFDRDRQTYTATRALLRTFLAGYLGSKPTDLVFHYSDKDKPSLELSGDRLEFNVSHSGRRALLAFARRRSVGVDVEHIRDDFDPQALAHRFFSVLEQRALATLEPEDRYAGFFRCWTRKEAYIKAVGTGLSLPLDQFDVSLRPGEENGLLSTRPDAAEAAVWSLREVQAGEGYAAALCVHGHGWRLKS
jgi:4'-phosphopantetheinyl transferase